MTRPPVLDRSTRTEQAKAARREEILAAARRVFAARGFRGTTIADIAEEAGVALGTIYLYFPSKQTVFAALNEQFNRLITDAVTSVAPTGSLEQTTRLRVKSVFDACGQNRDLIRLVVLNTDPDSEVARRMRDSSHERAKPLTLELQRAMEAGAVRAGDARIITHLVTGLVSIAVYQAFVVSNGEDAEEYATACADMLNAYLQPQNALPRGGEGRDSS